MTGLDRDGAIPIVPLLCDAQVAQLVEHVTENHGVGCSIQPLGTIASSSSRIAVVEA